MLGKCCSSEMKLHDGKWTRGMYKYQANISIACILVKYIELNSASFKPLYLGPQEGEPYYIN